MFEKVYCINLDRRTDRWEECESEFKTWKLKVERFRAFDGGDTAFNKSQLECIRKASICSSSLILEDDVMFTSKIPEFPSDWEVIYLGATVNKATKVNGFFRLVDGWATHAVGYKQHVMKFIIKNFNPEGGLIYDEWLRVNVMEKFKCYIPSPMVAYQRPSFSDIRNRFVDYTDMMKRGEELLK